MSDLQLCLSIGIPTVAVLIGILLNQTGLHRLEDRVSELDTRIDKRLTVIESDLRTFYRTLGQHDEGIEILKKKAGL